MEDGGHGSERQLRRATTSVSKQLEANNRHPNKGASFATVLSRDFSKQLHIPQEFTTNFNGYIPHRFVIESAVSNKCWRVEVEEDGDGKMYFRDGWAEFVEAHFLEPGNILVFEYEEQPIFQVKIYGTNGCERTLPAKTNGGHHHHLGKTTELDEDGQSEAFTCEDPKESGTQKRLRLSRSIYELDVHKRQQGISSTQKRTTMVSINESHVEFSITFHRRKKHQFLRLFLPKAVSREKNLCSKDKVVLQDVKGNCWSIKLTHKKDGYVIFSQGWKDFLKDNGIAAGDTLRFEFLSDNLIQVHVTRTSLVEQHLEETRHQNEATESLHLISKHYEPVILTTNVRVDEASVTKNRVSSDVRRSSFSLMWGKNTAGAFLHIPKAVAADQNLKSEGNVVLRGPDGKDWPVEVGLRWDGRLGLTKGWSEFRKGHGITEGDSLSFEFVSDCLIQVTIDRAKPLENVHVGAAEDLKAIANATVGAAENLEAIVNATEGAAINSDAIDDATEGAAINSDAIDNEGAAINSEATGNEGTAAQLQAVDYGEVAIKLEEIDIDEYLL